MAIQVWNGTEYVGAELARFGPSGTLKEALIWDGTQYVKVWPSGPPMSGTWGPIDTTTLTTVATYTTTEGGSYTLRIDSSPSVGVQITVNGGGIGSAAGSYSATVNLPAGAVVRFNAGAPGMNSGTWSVTKN